MKKVYLIVICIFFLSFIVEVQATKMSSIASGDWTADATWENVTINGVTYLRPGSSEPDTVIIEAGHNLSITTSVTYSGVLIVYGTLTFVQGTGGSNGTLTMDSDSKIYIRTGGEVTSVGTGNSHGQTNFIQIGTSSINGKQIADNLGSPDYLDQSTLAGGGGCQHSTSCTPEMLPVNLLYFKAMA